MAKHYVTFGQNHTHWINNQTLDCDCVAVFESSSKIKIDKNGELEDYPVGLFDYILNSLLKLY